MPSEGAFQRRRSSPRSTGCCSLCVCHKRMRRAGFVQLLRRCREIAFFLSFTFYSPVVHIWYERQALRRRESHSIVVRSYAVAMLKCQL